MPGTLINLEKTGQASPAAPSSQESQNLIHSVREEKVPLPAGFWASIVLDVLAVASAALTGWFYGQYVGGGGSFLRVILGLALFSLFSVFEMLLTKSVRRRFVVLVLEVAALLAFFVGTPARYLAAAGIGALILFLWGEFAGRREMENSLEIKFFRIVKPQLTKYMTGLVFVGILLYLPHVGAGTDIFSESQFTALFNWTTGVTANFYPEFTLTGSVQELTQSVAQSKLKTMAEYRALSPALQVQSVEQTAAQLVTDLGKMLNMSVKADQSVAAVLYAFLMQVLGQWERQLGGQFLLVWALAAFFIVRGLGIFFYLIVSFVSLVVYEGLLAANVITVAAESRMHEVVRFS